MLEQGLLLVEVGLYRLGYLARALLGTLHHRLHVRLLTLPELLHLVLYRPRQRLLPRLHLLHAWCTQRLYHQRVQLLLEVPCLLDVNFKIVVDGDLNR